MDAAELNPEEMPEPRAPLPTDLDEDLFEFPQPETGDGLAVAREAALAIGAPSEILVRAPRSAPGGTEGLDPDEDIFDFHELFTVAESEAGDEVIAYYAEPEADEAPPSAEAPEPPPEPARPVAQAPVHARISPSPATVGTGAPPVASMPTGTSSSPVENRLVLTLALGFILVNAALILTAWQASESFQSTLDYVRTDLTSALTDLRLQNELHAASPAPVLTPVPGPVLVPQAPTPLASFSTLELSLAQELIEAGAHSDARMRLYRLLANADRLVLEEAQIADAEYMIAEAYFAQGESLPEERR